MAAELDLQPPVHECPEHEHCDLVGCEGLGPSEDDWGDAVQLLVRFARATKGWTGPLRDDAVVFLREHAPEEVW